MRVIADLHIHSKYSRATSREMNLQQLAYHARIKGLNLLGTGDFTHPKWLQEIKEKLHPINSGLYALSEQSTPLYMITGEVCTIYQWNRETKKIHHLILAPGIEEAEQLNDILKMYGDLEADGRPVFNDMTSPELVEIVMEVDFNFMVIPAHAWTPWFSLYGDRSGFDSIKECYQDQLKHIHAIETGLSSDPPMNWRVSELDNYRLISNSDAHSPWPYRLGREANIIEVNKVCYKEIIEAIKDKNSKKFKMTIEVNPAYGKYHYTGHRSCGICLHPREALKLGGICPVCRRPLTVGVLQRVELLADRPEGYIPKNATPYMHLIPLQELITIAYKFSNPNSKSVNEIYANLIQNIGSELKILMSTPIDEIAKLTNPLLATLIAKMRKGTLSYQPGYDGEYGKIIIDDKPEMREKQVQLTDFLP